MRTNCCTTYLIAVMPSWHPTELCLDFCVVISSSYAAIRESRVSVLLNVLASIRIGGINRNVKLRLISKAVTRPVSPAFWLFCIATEGVPTALLISR